MKHINLLRSTLNPLLGWHGARLSFLALLLIALLRVTRSPELNSGERVTVGENHQLNRSCHRISEYCRAKF